MIYPVISGPLVLIIVLNTALLFQVAFSIRLYSCIIIAICLLLFQVGTFQTLSLFILFFRVSFVFTVSRFTFERNKQ